MGKLTYEDLISDMEYSCERCSAKCVKVDPLEPSYGYVSKADGKFVRVCKDCLKVIPPNEQQEQKHLVSAFVVAIQPEGAGYVIIRDGIAAPYLRDATVFEIKAACNEIVDDLVASKTLSRLTQIVGSQKAGTVTSIKGR